MCIPRSARSGASGRSSMHGSWSTGRGRASPAILCDLCTRRLTRMATAQGDVPLVAPLSPSWFGPPDQRSGADRAREGARCAFVAMRRSMAVSASARSWQCSRAACGPRAAQPARRGCVFRAPPSADRGAIRREAVRARDPSGPRFQGSPPAQCSAGDVAEERPRRGAHHLWYPGD